jgi:tRNA(fMet)-specific endonuclease VapC
MSLYILDTDHLSLFQRGHPGVTSHLRQVPAQEIAITIITAEEQARGRLAQVRAAKDEASRVQAFYWFRQTLALLSDFPILDYDDSASATYESLRRQKLSVGTQDLRIAAIALAVGGTLITRNARDFAQVTGLRLQDWTK